MCLVMDRHESIVMARLVPILCGVKVVLIGGKHVGKYIMVVSRGTVLFFFQAEDGIRDLTVTGVQTCALPIWRYAGLSAHNPLTARVAIAVCNWVQPESESAVARLRLLRGLGAQQGLDGASLVHRLVALGDLVERQCEVEHLAGVDLAVAHEVDE